MEKWFDFSCTPENGYPSSFQAISKINPLAPAQSISSHTAHIRKTDLPRTGGLPPFLAELLLPHLKICGSLSLQTQHPYIQRRCATALYKSLPGFRQEARGAGSRLKFGVYYRLGCLLTAHVHHSALIEANIFSPTFTFHSSQKARKINIQATSKFHSA